MTDMLDSMFDTLSPVEDSPSSVASAGEGVFTPSSDGAIWCETGGHLWEHTGRGRKPKNCPDHRTRNAPAAGTARGSTRKLEDLKLRLGVMVAGLGKGASFRMPVMGATMMANSVKAANAAVELAKNNPKVLNVLEAVTKTVPAYELGEVLAQMVVAGMVDIGRVQPDDFIAEVMGVKETYILVHGGLPDNTERPEMNDGMGTEVRRFQPLAV